MTIVGVQFEEAGRIQYFSIGQDFLKQNNIDSLRPGLPIIVETGRGAEYGTVAKPPQESLAKNLPSRKVLRIATPEDKQQEEQNRKREKEAKQICQEKIAHHKLDMHLVNVELTFDHSKIIFFFTADGRVDFRELVKDLASTFRMRIELRQIGVRDEAKMLNGIGICGCTLCCATFLDDFQPVSIKAAKDQGMSLNPTKISGVCGKLMCCLKYEEETYDELNKTMPGIGDKVETPDGKGTVISLNTLQQTVRVAVAIKNQDDTKAETYQAADIKVLERHIMCERGHGHDCNCGKCRRSHNNRQN